MEQRIVDLKVPQPSVIKLITSMFDGVRSSLSEPAGSSFIEALRDIERSGVSQRRMQSLGAETAALLAVLELQARRIHWEVMKEMADKCELVFQGVTGDAWEKLISESRLTKR